jgi:1,4-dihydroxy-2-naphthoate octaprenyltransferase
MPERFLTVSNGDSRLRDLLDGRYSDKGVRPVLVATLNPENLSKTEWTFEFIKIGELRVPSLMIVWLRALRPETLVLSLAPMFATAMWLARQGVFDFALMIQALVGVLALHASIGLFNDYHDHISGWDRLDARGGARVIGRGWLRALDVKRAAWAAFAIAILAGAPLVVSRFSIGVVIALLALLAALEFAVSKFGLKYKGFAEIAAWLMFGPLLTGGFYWAVAGGLTNDAVAWGFLYGSIALLILHLKNFERIMIDGRAGFRTWPVRAGFDASKTFAYFCVSLVLGSAVMIAFIVDAIPERLLMILTLGMGSWSLLKRVHQLESPVSGLMRGLSREGYVLAWWGFFGFVLGELVRTFEAWVWW